MTIVYITDMNYLMPTCVSIVSLINKCNSEIKIYVVCVDIDDMDLEYIKGIHKENVEISIISVNADKYLELASSCLSKGIHVSAAALYKFDLPVLLRNEEKVLYLDGDIIVNHDIQKLYDTDIDEYYLAAVNDMGDKYVDGNKSILASRIGLMGNSYFNSGVMLLNLRLMREDGISEKLLQYRMTQENYFMDQDAFNYVLESKRKELPITYNFRAAIFNEYSWNEINKFFYNDFYYSEIECIEDQVIVHLTDYYKPWKYYMRWFSDLFMTYYDVSPYRTNKLSLESVIKEAIKDREDCAKDNVRLKEKLRLNVQQYNHRCWRFPVDKVSKNSRIILWGYGNIGQDYADFLRITGYAKLQLIVDSYKNETGISVPEEIQNVKFDYVIICMWEQNAIKQIRDVLVGMGIEEEKIVSF